MSDAVHIRIKDIGPEHAGQVVCIKGWLRNKPGSKGRYFLWLRDGTGEMQAVAEQIELAPEVWANCERIGIESSVIAEGEVRAHPKQEGVFELGLTNLKVVQGVGAAEEHGEFPIGKKSHGVEFLMKHRHLWIRGKRQSAILRIRNEVQKAWADFFYERGFYRVDTPIFTPNACEGTTTLFEVDYHGDTVYLAQSGQLYNEADIGALGKVYCFGPTFRAEKSKTRRHLLEFWMLEMEAAFYDHEDNLRCQEEMMAFAVRRVLSNCLADLRELGRDPAKLEPATETPYPRLRYGEAMHYCQLWRFWEAHKKAPDKIPEARITGGPAEVNKVIEEMWADISAGGITFTDESFEDPTEGESVLEVFRWGDDYGAPDEVAIGNAYKDDPNKRYKPVFLTNFPVEVKGFYFKDELDEQSAPLVDSTFARLKAEQPYLVREGMSGHTILGADLIGSEGAGELIGGSQREDDYARLLKKIDHHQLPREFLQWYLDLRRFGNVPHSGFGVGLERVLCWLCGGSDEAVHIRETIAFPRMLHQFEP